MQNSIAIDTFGALWDTVQYDLLYRMHFEHYAQHTYCSKVYICMHTFHTDLQLARVTL